LRCSGQGDHADGGRLGAGQRQGAVLFSHERLDTWLAARLPSLRGPALHAALRNGGIARAAGRFDTVVVTSKFGEAEFRRVGVTNLRRIPLGVDLDTFRPRPRTSGRRDPARLRGPAVPGEEPRAP